MKTPHLKSRHNLEPVPWIAGDGRRKPSPGIGLCLSGGGYRAMLFHLGSLWRLNELGLLRKIERISSVSGGSITAAYLGYRWKDLQFNRHHVATNFRQVVVEPLRALARKDIDWPAVAGGLLLPGTVAEHIAAAYRRELFGDTTLQDLPDDTKKPHCPRFILNATSLQTGSLWLFSRASMSDYKVGEIKNPKVSLAMAVAASAAFPPFLSPVELELNPEDFTRTKSKKVLRSHPFRSRAVMCDGGVYDNLGLATVYKRQLTVLASDAGGLNDPEAEPATNWLLQFVHVSLMMNNEVQALRKHQLISAYENKWRQGAYWGINSDVRHYKLRGHLHIPASYAKLGQVSVRLKTLDDKIQEKLINWGYAISDVAIRKHYLKKSKVKHCYPYAGRGR